MSGKVEAVNVIKWKIKEFSIICKNVGEFIESPIFLNSWVLKLYSKGCEERYKNFISVYLKNATDSDITVSYTISVLNNNEVKVQRFTFDNKLILSQGNWGLHQAFNKNFIVDPRNNVLTDDTLTLLCEIRWQEKHKENDTNTKVPDSPSRLVEFDEFETILMSDNFSDVTLIVDDKKFPAHKNILTARSLVFKAMFTRENNQNVVEIKDINHEVFKELLQFIYTGKATDIKANAKDLLMAAEKYAVKGLKAKCEKELFKSISLDNAFEYLHLADTYNVTGLKTQIISFIKRHLKEVVAKPQFKEYTLINPILISDVMQKVITS